MQPPACSAHHRLALVGLLAGPRLLPQWCSAHVWRVGGLYPFIPLRISALRFLNCAFCLVFHLYSNVCAAKHISSNTSGTRSIVKAYVSKVCLFLPFWTLIGDRNCLLWTANNGETTKTKVVDLDENYNITIENFFV
jgi:hypothetical protein